MLGVAISRQAALHELLRQAESFGVSLLAGDQERLAGHFARGMPPIGLWEGVEIREGEGPPLLEGALGWITCERAGEHLAGDHTLFLGRGYERRAGTRPGRARLPAAGLRRSLNRAGPVGRPVFVRRLADWLADYAG